MCGRYAVLRTARDRMSEELFRNLHDTGGAFDGIPRYNASPMQLLPVLAMREGVLRAEKMLWWLIPHGAKDGKPLTDATGAPLKTFNAKGETLHESRLYAPYFKSARCLIPADAFYEWKVLKGSEQPGAKAVKQPMAIRMKDEAPFMFAGLFSVWKGEDGTERPSFTIITTEPNELMATIHRRMPVILKEKDYALWIDRGNKDVEQLRSLIKPYPATKMIAYAVSGVVSNSRNDVPECLEPLSSKEESVSEVRKREGAQRSPKR